ncbi:hypothetical protein K2X33_16125 [bacterium]|nr:hypothetical protein [bacterium]
MKRTLLALSCLASLTSQAALFERPARLLAHLDEARAAFTAEEESLLELGASRSRNVPLGSHRDRRNYATTLHGQVGFCSSRFLASTAGQLIGKLVFYPIKTDEGDALTGGKITSVYGRRSLRGPAFWVTVTTFEKDEKTNRSSKTTLSGCALGNALIVDSPKKFAAARFSQAESSVLQARLHWPQFDPSQITHPKQVATLLEDFRTQMKRNGWINSGATHALPTDRSVSDYLNGKLMAFFHPNARLVDFDFDNFDPDDLKDAKVKVSPTFQVGRVLETYVFKNNVQERTVVVFLLTPDNKILFRYLVGGDSFVFPGSSTIRLPSQSYNAETKAFLAQFPVSSNDAWLQNTPLNEALVAQYREKFLSDIAAANGPAGHLVDVKDLSTDQISRLKGRVAVSYSLTIVEFNNGKTRIDVQKQSGGIVYAQQWDRSRAYSIGAPTDDSSGKITPTTFILEQATDFRDVFHRFAFESYDNYRVWDGGWLYVLD